MDGILFVLWKGTSMVKVVGTGVLRDALDGLPGECYGSALQNPDGYFSHDVNPEPINVGKYPPQDEKADEEKRQPLRDGKRLL